MASLALFAGAAAAQQMPPGMGPDARPAPQPQRAQIVGCPSLQDLGMATPANVKPQTKTVEDPRIVSKVGKGWTQTTAPGTFFLRQVNFTVTDPKTIKVECDYGNGLLLTRSLPTPAQACQWAPMPKFTLLPVSQYYGTANLMDARAGGAGQVPRLNAVMEDSRAGGSAIPSGKESIGRPNQVAQLDKAERCVFFAKIETREGLDNAAFCALQCQAASGPPQKF